MRGTDRVAGWRWFAWLVVLIGGCASMGSEVDRSFLDRLDSLKTYHLSFIDQFTAGPGKQWDQAQVQSACMQGNSKFQEAAAYAEGKGGDRTRAVELLHDVFEKNCEFLGRGALLSPAASQQLKEEVQGNYADAVAGECSRAPGSPATC